MSDRKLSRGALLIGRKHDPQDSLRIGQRSSRYAVVVFPQRRGLRLRKRISRFVHALFGGRGSDGSSDDAEGGVGVREPRRPLTPSLSGAATLEVPDDDESS